jgi:ATP-dependent Zn protease
MRMKGSNMSGRPQSRITDILRVIAYHEAGHAVVAFNERVAIHSIKIAICRDYAGRVIRANPYQSIKLNIDNTLRARNRVRAVVRVLLAGFMAQKMKDPNSYRSHHDKTDRQTAADLILRIASPKTPNVSLKVLGDEVRDTLSAQWYQVEALAQELLKQRTLSQKEVRKVIMDASS